MWEISVQAFLIICRSLQGWTHSLLSSSPPPRRDSELFNCTTVVCFGQQQRQMFLKEIMFVIFISTESCQDYSGPSQNRTTIAWRPSPFCFSTSISSWNSTKKDCNFPVLPFVCWNVVSALYDNRMWCMSWFEVEVEVLYFGIVEGEQTTKFSMRKMSYQRIST